MRAFLRTPTGRWIKRRFSPREAFGLTFTIGLVFTALFSWVFGGVVEDVLARDPLVQTDVVILQFVYSHGDPNLTLLTTLFEVLFSPELLLPAGAVAGLSEPRDAAAITHGREDGWHGAAVRVPWMTPASHGWRTADITSFLRSGTAQPCFDGHS